MDTLIQEKKNLDNKNTFFLGVTQPILRLKRSTDLYIVGIMRMMLMLLIPSLCSTWVKLSVRHFIYVMLIQRSLDRHHPDDASYTWIPWPRKCIGWVSTVWVWHTCYWISKHTLAQVEHTPIISSSSFTYIGASEVFFQINSIFFWVLWSYKYIFW